jgi:hypothetical protein
MALLAIGAEALPANAPQGQLFAFFEAIESHSTTYC